MLVIPTIVFKQIASKYNTPPNKIYRGIMKIDSHLNALKQKHQELKRSIKTANDNLENEITIKSLKKQKLLLKEKISKLENI